MESEGNRWVIDMDLEKLFNKVNHDILMSKLERKIKDKRLLTLIRKYLKSGILINGLTVLSEEGTPQGGFLSPLLANIMLDEVDKRLEKRGHKFCRYAGDRVVIDPNQYCGKCFYCQNDQTNFCEGDNGKLAVAGMTKDGLFAKYFVCDETFVYKIPEELSLKARD